jgi:hypothetical protein
MSDLMQVPPTDSRVARATKNAVAGAAVVVIAVLAVSLLVHVLEAFVITAVITAAAVLAIGWVLWMLLFRRRR